MSSKWYEKEHTLAIKNVARDRSQTEMEVDHDEHGNWLYACKSKVKGTLQDNIECLKQTCDTLSNLSTKQHLLALVEVAEFVVTNGPIVRTQDAGKVYHQRKEKRGDYKYRPSMELYGTFCKHLNLAQVYVHGTAYLLENITNLYISTILSLVDSDKIVQEVAEERLQSLLPPSSTWIHIEINRS